VFMNAPVGWQIQRPIACQRGYDAALLDTNLSEYENYANYIR